MTKQMREVKSFLSYAFSVNAPFSGKLMREAHSHLVEDGLNDAHFDCVKQHLQANLQDLGIENEIIRGGNKYN